MSKRKPTSEGLSGPYRVVKHGHGLFIEGHGRQVPVRSAAEASELLKQFRDQDPDQLIPIEWVKIGMYGADITGDVCQVLAKARVKDFFELLRGFDESGDMESKVKGLDPDTWLVAVQSKHGNRDMSVFVYGYSGFWIKL